MGALQNTRVNLDNSKKGVIKFDYLNPSPNEAPKLREQIPKDVQVPK